jgi:hypothetical protein
MVVPKGYIFTNQSLTKEEEGTAQASRVYFFIQPKLEKEKTFLSQWLKQVV